MIRSNLTEQRKRLNSLNEEGGAASWLTTFPIKEEGNNLTTQLFWDLTRMRSNWSLLRLPSNCECDLKFDLKHALSCKKGFVSLRQNHKSNITASLLTKVCNSYQGKYSNYKHQRGTRLDLINKPKDSTKQIK